MSLDIETEREESTEHEVLFLLVQHDCKQSQSILWWFYLQIVTKVVGSWSQKLRRCLCVSPDFCLWHMKLPLIGRPQLPCSGSNFCGSSLTIKFVSLCFSVFNPILFTRDRLLLSITILIEAVSVTFFHCFISLVATLKHSQMTTFPLFNLKH